MAITNLGTRNSLSDSQIPTGYVKPTIAAFSDWQYHSTVTLSVLKATVQNADPAVTMANIFNEAAIGLNKQVADIIAADYLATATVTTFADLVELTTNHASSLKDSPAFTTTAVSYVARVNIYVKAL